MDEETDLLNQKFESMLEHIKGLFFEFGIKNLNMDDISHKLGISKKTLYRFVKSKEDLIARIFEYEQKRWVEVVRSISAQEVNAIEKLFKVSLMVYEEMKRFNPMILFELKKYYEPIYLEYQEKKMAHVALSMRLNLDNGTQEGLYRSDLNAEAIIAIYMNYLIEIHNSDYCKGADLSFDELFKIMFEQHIRAISTSEGVAYFETRKNEITVSLNKSKN
jgi:TetR/AcrR family transcriptional regulator, cholesterol catabolism regulator